MLAELLNHPVPARIRVPEELRHEEVLATPRPCLTVRALKRSAWERQERLCAELSFDYAGKRVADDSKGRGLYDAEARILTVRDIAAEESARNRLEELGVTFMPVAWNRPGAGWELTPQKLPGVVRGAVEAGWHIEADGKTFRRPGAMQVSVASGIDWFELHGEVDYGDTTAKLPVLLAALKRGESMVLLDDGTYGLLPEEWLSRFASLAGLGTPIQTTSASAATRRDCWMLCSRHSPKRTATKLSPDCATSCGASTGFNPACSRRASSASCATTSATGSAGWRF